MKRENEHTFRVYGINNAIALLDSNKSLIERVVLNKDGQSYKNDKLKSLIKKLPNNLVEILPKVKFSQKYSNVRSQGIWVYFKYFIEQGFPIYNDDKKDICFLLTEGIEDPQNLGQIIRTSECAGIDGILIPKHRSVGITNAVLQVSQGAFTNIPIYSIGNVSQFLKLFKTCDFWITAFENEMKSKRWCDIDLTGRTIIIVGSEGKGIRKSTINHSDNIGTIPMRGITNSLNVSASVSAILFERQRQLLKDS